MPRRPVLLLSLILTVGALVSTARGNWLNEVGRHLAIGWSDGNHSRNACPNTPMSQRPGGTPQPSYWRVTAPTTRARLPAGPSLFRQTGEGSSLGIVDKPLNAQ